MATARELLEQADALMRRNRALDAGAEDTGSGIPLLTEAVGSDIGRTERAPAEGTGPAGKMPGGAIGDAVAVPAQPAAGTASGDPVAGDFDDIPVLTDVVADPEPISVIGESQDGGEPSQWPEFAVREPWLDPWTVGGPAATAVAVHDATTPAPAIALHDAAPPALDIAVHDETMPPPSVASHDGASPAPEVALHDAAPPVPTEDGKLVVAPDPLEVFTLLPDPELPPTRVAAAPAGAAPVGDAARWEALAEEVRMQVLQRIDIFTDTGLQEQLTARLQPIVDRASADLVATINQQVGQLLRAYVAEAIEREIDKWRQDGA